MAAELSELNLLLIWQSCNYMPNKLQEVNLVNVVMYVRWPYDMSFVDNIDKHRAHLQRVFALM